MRLLAEAATRPSGMRKRHRKGLRAAPLPCTSSCCSHAEPLKPAKAGWCGSTAPLSQTTVGTAHHNPSA
jgi:hypothetical protein